MNSVKDVNLLLELLIIYRLRIKFIVRIGSMSSPLFIGRRRSLMLKKGMFGKGKLGSN